MAQQAASVPPTPPMAPQPQPQMPQQSEPVKKSHFMRILLILIALGLIVILSIYIYFSFVNKETPDSSTIQIENTISPTVPAPSIDPDEQELNNIDAGNIENDLKDVDADLQAL